MEPRAPSLQTAAETLDITVQISSRNRRDVLKKVLLSLADQTLPPERYEVVLVDDGSTDGTADMVAALQVPYSLHYRRQEHLGLSAGRNNGIRAARGRVILFIDDDVLADRRLLEEHLRSHQADERIVVNGWVNHVSRPERPAAPRFTLADISTSFFWTSNVSVKRRHLLECGLFDEDFKEYGWEDQEIGLRLMAIGLRARNNYRAVGYHVKRPPRKADLPRMLAQAEAKARTAALYVRKHRRLRTRLSTGTYPPRLVLDRLAGSLGLLEAFCRRRLARPGLGEQDELHGLDAWCARQLVNLRYYGTVRRELAKHPL